MNMNNLFLGGIFSLLNNLFNPVIMAVEGEGGGGSESTETGTATKEAPGWTKGLKADYQSNDYFTSKATVSELAEDALSMRTRLENSIEILGENATDEQKAANREKLGVPTTKDDYNFGDLTENEFLGWFKGEAHGLDMTQNQAEKLVGSFNKYVADAQAREKEANVKAVESDLRNVWGDAYEARITKAKNFAKKYGGEDFKVDDLNTIKLLDTFAGLVSEDSFGGGLGGQGGTAKKRDKGQLPLDKSFPGK